MQQQLETLWTAGTLIGTTDAQLLGRFNEGGGAAEAAFRELVDRHGSLVMGVCRQIARRPQDAEDAFQATFLVLVRKARSIQVGDSLASWLYGVACRTAHRARASASRYRTGEIEATAEAADSSDPDLPPILHEELARLPGKYREPIVLCHLEGKTHEEAAGLLAWPVGTVSGRLSRGRQLLKARLERRGVSAPSAMLAGRWLESSTIPPSLVHPLVGVAARTAASATLSTSVLSLTQGVLKTMFLHKIQAVSIVLVAAVAASGGVAWAVRTDPPAKPSDPADPVAATSPRAPRQAARPPIDPPMARPRNSPNMIGPRESLPRFRSATIIVAESPDRRSLLALSVDSGNGWRSLPLPEGVTASPVIGESTLAPSFQGNSIKEIAAFSRDTGVWAAVPLRQPAQDEINPVVLPSGAIYQVGNDIYAFSSLRGEWGVLHLDGPETPKISASTGDIEVLQGNRLHVFRMKPGHFLPGVEVNPKPFQRDPAVAKPAR